VFSDLNIPNKLNHSIDYREVTSEYDRLLRSCHQEWEELFQRDSDHTGAWQPPPTRYLDFLTFFIIFSAYLTDEACELRVKLLPLYVPRTFTAFALFNSLIVCVPFQLRQLRKAGHILARVSTGIPAWF